MCETVDDSNQGELFGDFRDSVEVFSCVAGHYVGTYTGDPEDPVERTSRYFTSVEEAQAFLEQNANAR